MDQDKQNKLIIHLLITIEAQVQAYRDVTVSYIADSLKLSQDEKKEMSEKIQKRVKQCENTIKGQVALYYEDKFGSVDDLLNGLN